MPAPRNLGRLDALADAELLAALAYARSQPRPVTAADLAAATGVHRNVAAGRLDRLVEAGLLAESRERRSGRSGPGAGRPAKVYAVVPELEALAFPPRRYELLFGQLVDELPARGRATRLRRVGAAYGRELAAAAGLDPVESLPEGVERVCDGMGRLGFQVSVVEAGERQAVLATPTCPLRPLVLARPEAAEIDRGMWAGLVGATVDGVDAREVLCGTADCYDDHASCRVLLRLRRRGQTP